MENIISCNILYWLTFRSPEMLAPACMPVTEGKKMANTLKKSWLTPSLNRKSG